MLKKDKFLLLLIFMFSIIISKFSTFIELDEEANIIEFLSIISGFLLSAIAIIYSSPVRKIMYTIKAPNYITLWEETISLYKFTIFFCIIFILFINLNFHLANVRFHIKKDDIVFSLFNCSIFLIVKVLKNFFKLLSIEINNK